MSHRCPQNANANMRWCSSASQLIMTLLLKNKTIPGMKASNPDPRTTDDKFVIELRASENPSFGEGELEKLVNETKIIELDIKSIA